MKKFRFIYILVFLLLFCFIGVGRATVTGPFEHQFSYLGLSTDTKPIYTIKVGTLFYETDTGMTYVYTGSNWVLLRKSDYAITSGLLSNSGAVTTSVAYLTDLAVYTNGTDDATVTLYDNSSAASGTIIGKSVVLGSSKNGGLIIPVPIKASNGIYISITGTGASAIVSYIPR